MRRRCDTKGSKKNLSQIQMFVVEAASTQLLRQLFDSSEETPAREVWLPPELPPLFQLQSQKIAPDQRSTSARKACKAV